MEKIIQTREIPVEGKYDVVVCGGGPAGIMAAVAAARCGARVVLVERYGCLGGMATVSTVAPISEFMFNGELVVGGLPLEFVNRLEEMGGGRMCPPKGNFVFHPEHYKLVAQRMVREAGVQVYLHSLLTGCQVTDGRISHVIVETKQGPMALQGSVFIDATGDGDLAYMAGVPMQETDGQLQPCTLCFTIDGVKSETLPSYYPGGMQHSRVTHVREKILAENDLANIPQFGGPWCVAGVGEGYAIVNMSRTEADFTDVRQATRAEMDLREDVFRLVQVLRDNSVEFADSHLVATAAQVGIRETRHIRGCHILTGEEYSRGERFADSVARCSHPIDIHSAKDNSQVVTYLKQAAYLPYRSIIAEGFANLLVPSRCFSADRVASASARVQAGVMGLGQAAGAAAAMCCREGVSVQNVQIDGLQELLRSWGAVI